MRIKDNDGLVKPLVYLVGAGPGDPLLLTLAAHKILTEVAEVVIYDRLVSQDILNFIPDNVEKIYAGKACNKHELSQDEINELLAKTALTGKIVARLKGGDPFIFGRGGEEMLYLLERDINVKIIPGINAANGSASSLGIALTHRAVASGVRFITGHKQKNEELNLNWQSLADADTTLVIYMGLVNLETICNKLIENGLDKKTPAVVIENGTLANERVFYSDVANIYNVTQTNEVKSPTLVIIGNVVAMGNTGKNRSDL